MPINAILHIAFKLRQYQMFLKWCSTQIRIKMSKVPLSRGIKVKCIKIRERINKITKSVTQYRFGKTKKDDFSLRHLSALWYSNKEFNMLWNKVQLFHIFMNSFFTRILMLSIWVFSNKFYHKRTFVSTLLLYLFLKPNPKNCNVHITILQLSLVHHSVE